MAKEVGLPKNVSKEAKALDAKADRAKNIKEESKADLAMDKKIAKADKADKLADVKVKVKEDSKADKKSDKKMFKKY